MRDKNFNDFLFELSPNAPWPLIGHWDITNCCNLICKHCYQKPRPPAIKELDICRAFTLIEEIARSGCLILTISGGEPLCHPKFKEIYACLYDNGIQIILFTNATLIDKNMVNWFKAYPPLMIEVTLHSLKRQVFEKITQVKGSFDACLRGIQLLFETKQSLTIKTVAMRENKTEIDTIKEFAHKNHAQFKFDSYLISPFALPHLKQHSRLSVDEAVKIEFQDRQVLNQWGKCKTDYESFAQTTYNQPFCSAGLHSFYINPQGKLRMCHLSDHPSFDLLCKSFEEGFFNFLVPCRDKFYCRPRECLNCPADIFCNQCPARAKIELKNSRNKVEYLCALAKKRYKIFNQILKTLPL
jgi:MoaA/NifB/PqqE/SkfB family radical SAM enzyme